MNQKDETDALLSEWLAEHTVAIKELRRIDTDLDELLDDHARLTKAIRYWRGKSEERVEEFSCMAKELQHEIAAILAQERYLFTNEYGTTRTKDKCFNL